MDIRRWNPVYLSFSLVKFDEDIRTISLKDLKEEDIIVCKQVLGSPPPLTRLTHFHPIPTPPHGVTVIKRGAGGMAYPIPN